MEQTAIVTTTGTSIGALSLDHFPVSESGRPQFAQRFGAGTGHNGTDIFAPRGTPVLAVRDGKIRNAVESKGGNVIYLTAHDGTRYFYGHLEQWKIPFAEGAPVKAGDVIATVGNTGNAAGKAPHVHFQMSDTTGGPVDPFPFLVGVAPPGAAIDPGRRSGSAAPFAISGGALGLAFLLWLVFRGKGRRG